MRRSKLDQIDRKILRRLQEDGRVTNVELAKCAGISAPPCLRRVRALEDNGFIKGFFTQLDHLMLGYGVSVFAQVKLKSQAEDELNAFEEYVNGLDVVRECHMLAGDFDFLIKVVAKDWDAYQVFLSKNLTSVPNVISVKSSLSIRSSKQIPGVPVD